MFLCGLIARALTEGDLDYFVLSYFDIAQMPVSSRDEDKMRNREYFRVALTKWLESFEPDTDIAIPTATACAIYNSVFPPLSVDAIGQFLRKHSVKRGKDQLGLRGRFYRVRWQVPKDIEADRAALKEIRNGKFTEESKS
jgi:hypothetical protein